MDQRLGQSCTSADRTTYAANLADVGRSATYGIDWLAPATDATGHWIGPPFCTESCLTTHRPVTKNGAHQALKQAQRTAGEGQNLTARKQLEAAGELYKTFNRFAPDRIQHVRQPRVMPQVVVNLGDLAGLIYRSDKWQPGHPRTYIHFMEKQPRLVSNVAGTQLYIIGGDYQVTARGIEG
jgi:hypothetical protein